MLWVNSHTRHRSTASWRRLTCVLSLFIVLSTGAVIMPAFSDNKAGLDAFKLATYCREHADLRRQMECDRVTTTLGASRCQLLTRRSERISGYIDNFQATHANRNAWGKEYAIAEASGKVDLATCRWEQRRLTWRSTDKLCGSGDDLACLARLTPTCYRMDVRCLNVEEAPPNNPAGTELSGVGAMRAKHHTNGPHRTGFTFV